MDTDSPIVGAPFLERVLTILHVRGHNVPQDLALRLADVTPAVTRKFLANNDIERSDHWIEFAIRSVPLNIGES